MSTRFWKILVRSGVVTVTAVGVAQPKTYNVTQEAKPEFITIDNGADMAADKGGGKVTVTGKSNSAALTFAWVGDDLEATIAAQYTAGGKSTDNGAEIEGDPGATAEYAWSVELTLPANETVDQVDRTLKVSNGSSVSQQIVIQQTAGDATLSLSETAITIPADGSAVSVNVTSNTSWTVS